MNILGPGEIIEETVKCGKGFKCMTGEAVLLCKFLYKIKDETVFFECLEKDDCSYKEPFGKTMICACPVRKEIWPN